MGRLRRALPLAAWLAALAAGLAVFHGIGTGPLATPPLTEPSRWGAWASEREPVEATVAVLRLVVLGLAWYLVGVTTVGLVARLARAARLVRIADALTVPVVRRLLQGALGLGLATAMVGAAAPVAGSPAGAARGDATVRAADVGDDPATVRLVQAGQPEQPRVPAGTTDAVELRRVDDGEAGPLPLELLGEAGRDTAGEPHAGSGPDGALSADEVRLARVADTHEVRPGESLWSIASDTLAAAWARHPSDGEIAGYWRRLIDDNRERLDDPDNPDLIFPGQEFVLPERGPDTAGEEV